MPKHTEDFDLESDMEPGPDSAGAGTADAGDPPTGTASRTGAGRTGTSRTGTSGTARAAAGRAPATSIRGALPWAALAAVLVLLGVVIVDPLPSPWQVGMLDEIGTPSEQWFVPVEAEEGPPPDIWLQPGAVVLARSNKVRSFDDSGEELWQVEGQDLRCEQAEPGQHVLCVSDDGDEAELIRLDPRNGEVERTSTPGLLAATTHGEDVLRLYEDDGYVHLQQEGPSEGRDWSAELGPVTESQEREVQVMLAAAGDYALVAFMAEHWSETLPPIETLQAVHHTGDGSEAPDLDAPLAGPLPGDPGPWFLSGSEETDFRYLNADGAVSQPAGTRGLWVMVDDDPTSDLNLTMGDEELIAQSADGETTYWSSTRAQQPRLIGRVDGQVLIHEGSRTTALNERTGSETWSEVGLSPNRSLSDGSTLLTIATDAGHVVLTGLDVRSGQEEFVATGDASESAIVLGAHPHGKQLAVVTNSGLSMWSLT